MKKKKFSLILVGCLITLGVALLVWNALSSHAQELRIPVPEQVAEQFAQLKLETSLSAPAFLQLQPILLRVRVKNPTSVRIWGHSCLSTQPSYIKLYVRKSGETAWRNWEIPVALLQKVAVDDRWIEPGESFAADLVIASGLSIAFPTPANYELYATFRNVGSNGGVIQSVPVSLSIVAPTGLNRQAYNYIMASERTDFLGDHIGLNFPKDRLLAFNRDFGNSTYGAYTKFKLARWYVANKEYAAAEVLLTQVVAQPDFLLLPEANRYLAQAREGLTQP